MPIGAGSEEYQSYGSIPEEPSVWDAGKEARCVRSKACGPGRATPESALGARTVCGELVVGELPACPIEPAMDATITSATSAHRTRATAAAPVLKPLLRRSGVQPFSSEGAQTLETTLPVPTFRVVHYAGGPRRGAGTGDPKRSLSSSVPEQTNQVRRTGHCRPT